MSLKVIRLTILLLCCNPCFWLVSCANRPGREAETVKRPPEIAGEAVDLNAATATELEKLPLIGKELAQRIVEFRQRHGKFRRAEHLILVRGMSDKKFRQLQNLVKVE